MNKEEKAKTVFVCSDSYDIATKKANCTKKNGFSEVHLIPSSSTTHSQKDCMKAYITAFIEAGYTPETLNVPSAYNLMKDQAEHQLTSPVIIPKKRQSRRRPRM